MQIRADFPRSVRTVEHVWIPLPDGGRLAARMWLPDDAERDPVPAILDAVPYRKGDGTAAGDAPGTATSPGTATRACGSTCAAAATPTGCIDDEYTGQEAADVDEVIAWLAAPAVVHRRGRDDRRLLGRVRRAAGRGAQPARTARDRPIHASDDRYADDVHYFGGCVLATDMVHWATCMAAYVAQPPDPAVVGEGWRDAWRARLERMEPWVARWLAHQRRDDYWRRGSACERYARSVPRLRGRRLVDGYRDMVLRMVEHAGAPVRGLIGPWGHTWPEAGAPGPAIGFLQECVRFFDHALKGVANGFLDEPALVS